MLGAHFVFNPQAEDGKDKVRKKFAPKLNEEISSDSETER